jgi:hypothetical protein
MVLGVGVGVAVRPACAGVGVMYVVVLGPFLRKWSLGLNGLWPQYGGEACELGVGPIYF